MEPHDYRVYYVNIDLRHQYGISVAESQTFLRAKRPSGEERGETHVFARYKNQTFGDLLVTTFEDFQNPHSMCFVKS